MKYNVSSCHKRYFKSLCHSPHLCLFSFHHNLSYITLLILLLSGDIDLNPGPEDEVKCVCESSDESGLMLQCDSCTCWSHSECVGCFLSCSKKIIFLSVLFALSQSSLSYPLFVLNFTPKSSLPNWNFLTKLSFLSLLSFLQFNKVWQCCHPKSTLFLNLICQLIMFLINNPLYLQLKFKVFQQSHVHLPVLLPLFVFHLRTMSHILTNQFQSQLSLYLPCLLPLILNSFPF